MRRPNSVSSIVQILGAAMARLRTRISGRFAIFALLVSRLGNGYFTLPSWRKQPSITTYASRGEREQMSGDELLGDQLLRGRVCAHVAAPVDFTARVMARMATESIVAPGAAPVQFAGFAPAPEDSSLLHQASAVFVTLGI